MEIPNDTKKRVRDELARLDSPDSKIPRVASDSGLNSSESRLSRVDSGESCIDSDAHLQDEIFNILDDADNVPERDSVQGLDSVIKSFEDEINAPGSDPGLADPTQVPDSGELQTSLGYLLEASDDELGLPPTVVSGEEPGRVGSEGVDLTGFVGFEDDIPSYDAFGFGTGLVAECDGIGSGFVTVDGLFDYDEPAANILWRSESLQAM